ncbi:MAG: hypothetical protein PHI36_01915 [Bacteroidales bacterium]|nr:hypothetical protein [Bacteroidales bacterium]
MNKKRLKELSKIYQSLSSLTADLEELMTEETEAYENMPDSIQNSDKGIEMSGGLDFLSDAVNSLYDSLSNIEYFNVEEEELPKDIDINEKIKIAKAKAIELKKKTINLESSTDDDKISSVIL